MSNGLFQNLPGSSEMTGGVAFPNEPWLLPISDRVADAGGHTETLLRSVRRSGRPARLALHGLIAALALVLAGQIGHDWFGTSATRPSTHQIADASPPTISVTKAALTASN